MLVHFVTDEPTKIPAIRAMLEPQYCVAAPIAGGWQHENQLGRRTDGRRRPAQGRARWNSSKLVLKDLHCVSEKLFVVQSHLHHMVAQAFALGATAVVSRPKRSHPETGADRSSPEGGTDPAFAEPSSAITNGAAAFASMFAAIREGKLLMLSDAESATSEIIHSIEQNGLGAWLDDVRRYHQGTFQHCLLVTGVAVGFALDIKFPSADVKRLGLAATLHDIGKARIPLPILDKPGRLDAGEEEIMRSPSGYRIRTVEGAPRGQPGNSRWREAPPRISRRLRLSRWADRAGDFRPRAIADDLRHLRRADRAAGRTGRQMSRQDAYNILCNMDGKLERSLVKAFRNVALRA